MSKAPCEYAVWKILPVIRKELACCMVREFGLTQKEAAEKLGITPAAISQYKCNKRGRGEFKNIIHDEIQDSTKKLIESGSSILTSEICRLCKIIQKNTDIISSLTDDQSAQHCDID